MSKLFRLLGAGLLSFWVVTPIATGVGAVVTALLGQVSGLGGWWNALFLAGIFLTTFGLAAASAQVGVAALEQHGPLAKRIGAGRALREAYSAMETELLTIQIEVNRALETGTWWLTSMTLSAASWREHSSLLSRGEADEREVYSICQKAFVLCDEANRLVHRHHANPPTAEHLKTLAELRDAISGALESLGRRLNSYEVNS